MLLGGLLIAAPDATLASNGRYCTRTARFQMAACHNEVDDDYLTARAICVQIAERDERIDCVSEARAERREELTLCREQFSARRDLCDLIGEDRYDPEFDPDLFLDDFGDHAGQNPYYPLVIGHVWEFEAEDETNRIEVLDKTKFIEGVHCVVVSDVVSKEEGGGEDTDDWFGLREDGTVAYCGESVRDFEVFEGDMPQDPELVETEGSFKAGRDGDLSGTLFPANPQVGDAYRQEWSAGNAEDAAFVVSTTYGYGVDPELDAFMPQELAETLCDGDCVVTGEITPIEPDTFEYKFYALGIGLFFEVKPEDGEFNQLVACNFDPRCDALPERE